MVDYSKWDMVDSDDEDVRAVRGAPSRDSAVDRRAHHDQSLALIAEWVREAYPRIDDAGLGQLMRFVSVQHPGVHAHNTMRHQGITAFLEAASSEGRTPSLHALLALGHLAKERSEAADAEVAGRGGRVLVVAMHALNTLVACEREGGARRLFDVLLHAPEGEVGRRYRALEYATECVRDPPPDPHEAPPAAPGVTARRSLCRALLVQLVVALLAALLLRVVLGPQDVPLPRSEEHRPASVPPPEIVQIDP